MTDFVALGATVALIYTFVGLVRRASAGAWDEVKLQVLAWLSGVGASFLLSKTDFAAGLEFAGVNLAHANLASVVLIGLSWGAVAMSGKDVLKAVDSTQSAKEPPLGGD